MLLSLSFTLLPPLSSLLPLPFRLFLIAPHLPHLVVSSPLPPHACIYLPPSSPFIPYRHCLSAVMLSTLPSYPPQSHLIPLSARPFIHFPVCHFSYFIACHSQFCLNSAQTVTFKNQQAAHFFFSFFLVEHYRFFFDFRCEMQCFKFLICCSAVHVSRSCTNVDPQKCWSGLNGGFRSMGDHILCTVMETSFWTLFICDNLISICCF